ncbi:MAG: hypothetical protein ACLGI3_12500, partial [Actinomycetes bacterium]
MRQVTGNQGLMALLGMRQPSLQRQLGGDDPSAPAGTVSVQRDDAQAADAREAGRRDRAARREALAERRKAADARWAARNARTAGQQGPANQPAAAAAAAPAAAAGPTAAEIMAAKLAKFQELQNKRQAELAPKATGLSATAERRAPPAQGGPDHAMAARLLSDLGARLRTVAEPVTHQKIYG